MLRSCNMGKTMKLQIAVQVGKVKVTISAPVEAIAIILALLV